MVGSACFAVGSVAGYSSLVGERADAVTYFVGSIFFTSAAYLQYVECISTPRDIGPDAPGTTRVFAIEIRRIDWWATVVQLAGTLFFNVTTFTALDSAPDAEGGRPGRLDAGRVRLDLLPGREPARVRRGRSPWISWRPREHGLADRGAQPARVDLLRHLGDRRLDRALDRRPAGRGAGHAGTFWGAICFLVGATLLLRPATEPEAA